VTHNKKLPQSSQYMHVKKATKQRIILSSKV